MKTKSFTELYESMRNNMITHCSKVSDYNEGSIIRTILESVASVIEQSYIDTRIGFSNNLKESITSIFGFERKEGTKATVSVVFSRNKATSLQTLISAGTKVSDGTHIFITSTTAVIESGETESNSVTAQAEEIGEEYNVIANAISNIDSVVSDEVVAVVNESAASGGTDKENDTNFLIRFKTYLNGLQGSNEYGLKNGILALDGVRSVGIQEHFPPENNIYNATVYIDDGSGSMTSELKAKIEKVINGDEDENLTGLRAAGININVKPAVQIPVTISGKIIIYRAETAQAMLDIEDTLKSFINDLEINQSVILAQVQNVLMKKLSYITDIQGLKLNGLTDSIRVGINQIAVYEDVDIEIEVE